MNGTSFGDSAEGSYVKQSVNIAVRGKDGANAAAVGFCALFLALVNMKKVGMILFTKKDDCKARKRK